MTATIYNFFAMTDRRRRMFLLVLITFAAIS